MTRSKRKREDSPISHAPPEPSNSDYQYSQLPTPTSIRIIQLQPGIGTTTLRCNLSIVERGHAPPYEAISYSWGSSETTRVIYCEGEKLRVTLNLRDALWRIRDAAEVKTLWADAVCINQNDNEERANQVKEMGKIYSEAVRVLVWLDVPNAKFGDFDYLFDLDVRNPKVGTRGGRSQFLEDYVSKVENADVNIDGLHPDSNMVAYAFSHLLDSPWFTRLWVVQEVGLAKSVVAMYGDTSIDFADLIRFILRIESRTLIIDKLGLVTAAKAYIFTTFPARSIELAGDIQEDWDFLELMEVTRSQKAADSRDYVYALLGHPCATIDGVPIVTPNYNRKPHDLFFDLAVKLISSTNSLRVLSAVHHMDESFLESGAVSWISNWNRDAVVTSLGVSREWYYDTSYDACAGMAPIWQLEQASNILRVHGFVIDSVLETVSTGENDITEERFASKPIDQVIEDTFVLPSRDRLSPLDNLMEIGHTITIGYSNDKPHNFSGAYAAFRLHLIKEAYNQGRSLSIDLSPEGNANLRAAAAPDHLDGIYWSASRFCTGRKVFTTKSGRLGLGPGVLQEGDICCILFGASVPFILRRVESCYKVVGEAYIHGVMKGEAVVDWMLRRKYQEQYFELR